MTPNYVGGTQSNRWLFTAEVMTAFLRDTVNAKAVDATRLPRAVHRDACEFFALALGRKSAEPPVSANAYGLAIEALQSPRVANDMRAAPEKLLSKLAAFNKHLATTRPPVRTGPTDGVVVARLFQPPQGRESSVAILAGTCRSTQPELSSDSGFFQRCEFPRMPRRLSSATVGLPSMSRVLGHLNELRASLDAFHDDDYPGETCRIRDLFLVVLYHCKQRLDSLAVSADVNDATDYQTFPAIRAIDTDLQHLFSYLRYLRATSAGQTPPAVQFAATQLIDSYFPAPSNGTPLCIVRPQWRYNLEYAALGRVFANILQRPYLDPGQVFVGKTPVDVLRLAWQQWYAAEVNTSSDRDKDRARAPEQVGILSFSGLDTNDPFSLPILAHELGHFIDDSYPSSLSQAIYETVKIPIKDVRAIFFATDGKHTDLVIGETHDRLLGRLRRTVAELLADRLAARMAGIAYFMAQAERLSSSSEAAGPKIMYQDGGYPGTHLRLTRILDHITSTIHPGNVITFFESAPAAYRSLAQQVLAYLAAWKNLTKDFHLSASLKPIHDRLEERLGVAVAAAEPLIDAAAVKAIPGDVANALTHRFYRRIEALRTNLPPLLEGDQPNCFGEILAAAWVYQLVFGSEKEHALQVAGHVEEARKEEDKIFRLVYKALELVSATRRRHLVSHQPLRVPDAPTTATLQSTPKERLVGLLSGPEIERRQRDHLPLGERLFVVPRFDKVIQGSSLEIHIGPLVYGDEAEVKVQA